MKFAGFIMTFERETILKNTIDSLFSQTFPPEKILVIDNSYTDRTAILLSEINNPKVIYYRVGYNSGPAGAAKIGLKILAEEGYDWIYWGDDDDPPIFSYTFEILMQICNKDNNCGCVGAVGHFFNTKTGLMNRVSDEELIFSGVFEVDSIAGNMSKIVNGEMIRKYKILPDEKLFFGFEELDFDLQIKKNGYKLLVDRQLYYEHRKYSNRLGLKKRDFKKKNKSLLIREYYSIRNILYITKKNHYNLAFIKLFFYFFIKQFLGFRFGLNYGYTCFKNFFLSFYHFITSKMGQRKNYNLK
jgi:GT2 family glycosyltransferase